MLFTGRTIEKFHLCVKEKGTTTYKDNKGDIISKDNMKDLMHGGPFISDHKRESYISYLLAVLTQIYSGELLEIIEQ